VGVGTIGAGGVKGVGDNNSNSITINSFLEKTRFRELIIYIKVSYV